MPGRILVVEDDPRIAEFIHEGLTLEGYNVTVAGDGESGLLGVRNNRPDLVILDVVLPGLDGFEICRRLRAEGRDVPILMLTARQEVTDKVTGLDAGADDYLTKPFDFYELLARIRALLRRRPVSEIKPVLRHSDLVMDTESREVWRGRRRLRLTAKEYALLEFFLQHPRQVLTRDLIYERVWGYDFEGESNIIDVYVRYLRQKLEAGGEPRILQTVRGVGYALREG
jgi:DNA-binding response OmpR family regulator